MPNVGPVSEDLDSRREQRGSTSNASVNCRWPTSVVVRASTWSCCGRRRLDSMRQERCLRLAGQRLGRPRSEVPLVLASAGDLPFGPRSLGGAVASRVHLHLSSVDNPLALADLHRSLVADAPVLFDMAIEPAQLPSPEAWAIDERTVGRFGGRMISRWTDSGLEGSADGRRLRSRDLRGLRSAPAGASGPPPSHVAGHRRLEHGGAGVRPQSIDPLG